MYVVGFVVDIDLDVLLQPPVENVLQALAATSSLRERAGDEFGIEIPYRVPHGGTVPPGDSHLKTAGATIGIVPNQPKTPQWTYRAPRETQLKARAKAKREGTNLVAKINEWLEEYTEGEDALDVETTAPSATEPDGENEGI